MKVLIGIPNPRKLIKEDAFKMLESQFTLVLNTSGKMPDRKFLEDNIGDIDGYIVGSEKVDAELLCKAKNLKVMARYGVGYDNIDVDFATKKGIYVTTTVGANANSVAEHTVMLMLAAMRRATYFNNGIRNGEWEICEFPELSGKSVGIIGFGRIGKRVAKLLSGFGVNVLVYDPFVSSEIIHGYGAAACTLGDLLSSSDIVSLNAAGNDKKTILGKEEFEHLKDGAVIVNTSRGFLIDENVLYEKLKTGSVAAAGLDVVQEEPCTPSNKLLVLPNVVMTPHIAGGSLENHKIAGEMCANAIVDVLVKRVKPQTSIN